MEVIYDVTPEDVWQFHLFYYRRKSRLRPAFRIALIGVVALIVVCGLLMLAENWVRHRNIQGNLLISVAVIVWVISQYLPPSKARVLKNAVSKSGLICRHSMALDPKWLSEKTEVNETKARWDTIDQVVEDAHYIYIFISKTNAYIVPKRAFHYPAEAQAFVDTAKNFWMSAKNGESASNLSDNGAWPPPPRRTV